MAFNPTKTRTWKDGKTPATGTQALGSLFDAEFNQLYENWNEFFNPAGTIFTIDTINEKTLNTGVTIDGSLIKDGIITDDGSDGVGIQTVDGSILRCKILEIGDWNMTTTVTVNVAHGLGSNYKKIRTIEAIIRDDNDVNYDPIYKNSPGGDTSGWIQITGSTNIALYRVTSGGFDTADYDSTSYNRGWITIWYTD